MNRRVIGLAVVTVAAVAAGAWLWMRPGTDQGVLSGYVEGDPLYLSAPVSGTVAAVYVREGDRVAAGRPVFLINPGVQAAQRERAAAGVAAARAEVEDLRKGQRAAELEVFDAERSAAEAELRRAEAEYGRIAPLVRRGIYAPARLDAVRSARDAARAQVEAVARRRQVGTLGGREDAVAAAEQRVREAEGGLHEVEQRLGDLAPRAPVEARVEEVFFQPGEWAAANQPVAALLADGEVKLRFFAPQADLARYRVGREVRFRCDGCGPERRARITWVSPRPEFTPPVIYSREARDRLVFLVEAAPEQPRSLAPGQPVDVRPVAEGG